MKKLTTLLLTFVVLLVVGCQGNPPAPATAPEPTVAQNTSMATAEPADVSSTGEPTGETSDTGVDMAGPDALVENSWQWVAFTNPVEEFEVESPESYVITFNADGTLAIQADCNNVAGSYTADDSSLTIEPGPTTLAACPEGSRGEQFVELLRGAAIYFFQEGNLYIDLMADGGTLEFAPMSDAGD